MTSQTTRPALEEPAPPSLPEPDRAAARRMLLGPVLLGLFLVIAFAGLMVPALQNPTPTNLPIGVAGPAPVAEQVTAQLAKQHPDAFDVEIYPTADEAREAISGQEIVGAVVLAPSGPPSLLMASAAGEAPTRVVTAVHEELSAQLGGKGEVQDVAPLPEDDARGISGFLLSVALVIGALLFQATLSLLAARLPARSRLLAAAGYSVAAGLVGSLLAGPLTGALPDHFLALAGIATLLSLAVVGIVAACQSLFGLAGVAIGALIVLPLGVSSSGGPVDHHFLPAFYSTVSQYLPMGSMVSVLRRLFYFDANNITEPLLVLTVWAAAAWLVALVMQRLRPFRPAVVVLPAAAFTPGRAA